MEPAALIENLIEAIQAIHVGDTSSLEDAKETASLARMVLPTLEAPTPAAPVGDWIIEEEDSRTYIGMFASEADAEAYVQLNLDPAGVSASVDKICAPSAYLAANPTLQPQQPQPPARHLHPKQPHQATQGPPQPAQGVQALCSCGASNDYNGDCTDPNCPDGNYVPSNAAAGSACPDCGDPLNASGECDGCGWHPSGPGFPTAPIPAQSFDEVMADVHTAANRHRPGSVISNRPPGSLYKS